MAAVSASSPTNGRKAYKPPTLLERVQGIVGALLTLAALYICGTPGGIVQQTRAALGAVFSPSPQAAPTPVHALARRVIALVSVLFSPLAWRNAVIANGLPVLLDQSDKMGGDLKRQTIQPYAKGKTLEVGAGTGLTVKYYDADKISDLYLIEPMKELHPALRSALRAVRGLSGKSHIVPFGIEKRSELSKLGVKAGSFDTIVLVQVLCSIPTPEKHIAFLQTLLKPGGQLLLYEHVLSDDALTARIQRLYNPIWTCLSGGCNVNRDSGASVASLGGWSTMDVRRPDDEHRGELYPHAVARFVKA